MSSSNMSGFTVVVSKKDKKAKAALEKKNSVVLGSATTRIVNQKPMNFKKAKKANGPNSSIKTTGSASNGEDMMAKIDNFAETQKVIDQMLKEGSITKEEEEEMRVAISASLNDAKKAKEKKEEPVTMSFAKAAASKPLPLAQFTLAAELPNIRITTKQTKPSGARSALKSAPTPVRATPKDTKAALPPQKETTIKNQTTGTVDPPAKELQKPSVKPAVYLEDTAKAPTKLSADKATLTIENPVEETRVSKEEKKKLKRKAEKVKQKQAKAAAALEQAALLKARQEAAEATSNETKERTGPKKADPEVRKRFHELLKSKRSGKKQAPAARRSQISSSNGAAVPPSNVALTKKEKEAHEELLKEEQQVQEELLKKERQIEEDLLNAATAKAVTTLVAEKEAENEAKKKAMEPEAKDLPYLQTLEGTWTAPPTLPTKKPTSGRHRANPSNSSSNSSTSGSSTSGTSFLSNISGDSSFAFQFGGSSSNVTADSTPPPLICPVTNGDDLTGSEISITETEVAETTESSDDDSAPSETLVLNEGTYLESTPELSEEDSTSEEEDGSVDEPQLSSNVLDSSPTESRGKTVAVSPELVLEEDLEVAEQFIAADAGTTPLPTESNTADVPSKDPLEDDLPLEAAESSDKASTVEKASKETIMTPIITELTNTTDDSTLQFHEEKVTVEDSTDGIPSIISEGSREHQEATKPKSRSLFDRIEYGPDGQPVRDVAAGQEVQFVSVDAVKEIFGEDWESDDEDEDAEGFEEGDNEDGGVGYQPELDTIAEECSDEDEASEAQSASGTEELSDEGPEEDMALQANILPKRSMFDRIAIGPDGLPEREEPAGGIQYLVEENDDDSSEDAHDEQGTNEDDEAWEDIEDGEVLDTIWEDEEEPEIDQTLATSIEHQHALHPTPHDSIVKELSDHGDEKDAGETMADEIDLLTEPYDPEDPMLRPEEIAKSSTNTTQLLDQEPYDPEDPMLRPEELAMFPKHTTRLLDRVPTFTVVITEVFAFEESAGTVSASSKDTHAPPPVSLDVGIPISTEELLETQAATDSRGNLLETETELPDNVQEILSNRKKPIQGVNTVTSVLLKMLILLALTIGVCLFSYFVVPKLWESSIILFCGILGMISCRFREAGGWETNMQDSIGGAGLGVGGARRVQRDRERNEDGIEH